MSFPPHARIGDTPGEDHDQLDRALTGRLVQGDEGALAELMRMYWASIVTYAAVYLGNPDTAQDIAQESFARLWRQRTRWIAGEPARPFLYRVAHNLAHNEQRHRLAEARWMNAERSQPAIVAPSAAQLYDADILHDEIQRAILALPERRRQVFILARFDGLTHREIADLMGISVQTVANQMSAALAGLRSVLEPFIRLPAPTAGMSRVGRG